MTETFVVCVSFNMYVNYMDIRWFQNTIFKNKTIVRNTTKISLILSIVLLIKVKMLKTRISNY